MDATRARNSVWIISHCMLLQQHNAAQSAAHSQGCCKSMCTARLLQQCMCIARHCKCKAAAAEHVQVQGPSTCSKAAALAHAADALALAAAFAHIDALAHDADTQYSMQQLQHAASAACSSPASWHASSEILLKISQRSNMFLVFKKIF